MEQSTSDAWLAGEAITFSLDAPGTLDAAVDRLLASLDAVELLGLGEALHGGEELLVLRNRLFERLVEAHGYSAIAVESSFPRARAVNEYVAGRGPQAYEAVRETGFSHGFGAIDANRELVEWMRHYNSDPQRVKLSFYGFDSPSEMYGNDSPRQLLQFVLDYLASIDPAAGRERRQRIEPLLGDDYAWENPAAMIDPSKAIGLSPAASQLRLETEDLLTELRVRRPELVAASDYASYAEAAQYGSVARQFLNYHATLGRSSANRMAVLLGMRDAMMAENLAYMVSRERGRGNVLAFAHNRHLQRGQAEWQLGADLLAWWPAGAQLDQLLGSRYAVIGTALGVSEDNGIDRPEDGTLEALLTALPGPGRFVPTHRGERLPEGASAALPARSGSMLNLSYFPLSAQSFTDFDWLAVLDSTTYTRGAPPLQQWDADAGQ